MLAIGAALFKPNIAPTVLDQNPHKLPHVITQKDGKRVIVDPEATSESIMLVCCGALNLRSRVLTSCSGSIS